MSRWGHWPSCSEPSLDSHASWTPGDKSAEFNMLMPGGPAISNALGIPTATPHLEVVQSDVSLPCFALCCLASPCLAKSENRSSAASCLALLPAALARCSRGSLSAHTRATDRPASARVGAPCPRDHGRRDSCAASDCCTLRCAAANGTLRPSWLGLAGTYACRIKSMKTLRGTG